jgi:hypothetical protein
MRKTSLRRLHNAEALELLAILRLRGGLTVATIYRETKTNRLVLTRVNDGGNISARAVETN